MPRDFEPELRPESDSWEKLDQLCNIRSRYNDMPRSHKKIARYMLENLRTISKMTITKIADKAGVDPASITRFCQSMGFSGFPDFKFSVDRNIISPILDDASHFSEKDSPSETIQKTGLALRNFVEDTILLLDAGKIEMAANLIASAPSVHVYSHGSGSSSAHLAQALLQQTGIPCYAFPDSSHSSIPASLLRKGDLAIGISSSGSGVSVVDALTMARKRGAGTVCISGSNTSPLAEVADVFISYHSRINDDLRFMHMARMCELAIIGILQIVVLNQKHDTLDEHLKTVKKAILKTRYDNLPAES